MEKFKISKTKIIHTIDQGYGKFLCQGLYGPEEIKVIIEIYSINDGASRSDVDELLERVKLYKHLNHPNISAMVDGGDLPQGGAFLAVEMEDELRLIDRLRNEEWLSPKEATALVIDLAKALQLIHKLEIIHGELRPSNILFNPHTGHVKLRNIFKYKNEKEYVLKMVSRRPEYVAPEQIRFEEVDHRTDMYSLGLIYYQMLTGKMPVEAKSIEDIWRFHLEGETPVLDEDLRVIHGLQAVVETLLQKRKKSRYETDEKMIEALEDVYDHLFVEEESSHGRIVTVETSRQQREEKKSKGKPHFDPHHSKRMKKESAEETGWKKGERQKLKRNQSRRLAQIKSDAADEVLEKAERSSMKGPLIFAGVALLGLLYITKVFFLDDEEVVQSEFAKDPVVLENEPKKIIPKANPVTEDGVKAEATPMAVKVNEQKVDSEGLQKSKPPEKFASKMEEVKAYGKLPPKEAIEKIKLFLDDEDVKVRMLAVQLYQDLKHQVFDFNEEASKGSLSNLDMMKLKLNAPVKVGPNKDVPINLVKGLANDSSDDATQILIIALGHELKEVREEAIKNLALRKTKYSFKAIAEKLIEHPGDEALTGIFVSHGLKFMDDLDAIIDSKGDATALFFIEPLALMGGEGMIKVFANWAEKRPSVTIHAAMELVQLGDAGVNALIDLLGLVKKPNLAMTYLAALREAHLKDEHISRLVNFIPNKLMEEPEIALKRLLALRKPELEIIKDHKFGAEQQAVTLMLISEMKSPPSETELKNMVDFLGTSGDAIDERILAILETEGSRSQKYLNQALRKKLSIGVKTRLVKIMASFGDDETLSQLVDLMGSNSNLSLDLKDMIYKKVFLSGDKLIPIAMQANLNLKEKINILVDLNSQAAQQSLLTFFEGLKSVEFKKAYVFLLERNKASVPFVEKMLDYKFNADLLLIILKALEKSDLDLDINLYAKLMNHDNDKVREAIFNIFRYKLDPSHEAWKSLYSQAKFESSKLLIIKAISALNVFYSEIIHKAIDESSEALRLAAYEKVTAAPMKEEAYGSAFFNRLYHEESKKAMPILINHLLTRPGAPSFPFCIWSLENGSKTIRKITDEELALVSGSREKIEKLQSYLLEDYNLKLRLAMLNFLNQIKVDYLPFLLDNTILADKDALELLRYGVKLQSKKSAAVLLSTLGQTKNSELKKEIESLLEVLKVAYRLDPDSGKYILK